LGTEGLQEFEEKVHTISDLAFGYGMKKVNSFNPLLASREEAEEFVGACHEGYALAQKSIVDELLKIEAELRLTKSNIKNARRERNKPEIEHLAERLGCLERRRMILRRIADGMAWVVFGMRRWVVKRFFLGEPPPYLDATNLASVIAEVDRINRDPLSFALIIDITSFIQVGDILKIDWGRESSRLSLIELKEGVVNVKVQEFLENFYRVKGCPRAAWFFTQEEGTDALKQAIRVMKQQIRGCQVEQAINTEKGIDLATGLPLLIPDEVIEEEDYDEILRELVKTCKSQGYALSIIDNTLWLGAFDTNKISRPDLGFAYSIYYATRPETTCPLSGLEENMQSEFSKIRSSLYPIIDLRQGLYTPLSMPLFLRHLEEETIFDIIFGRIAVLTHLDFDRFFERVKNVGIVGR